METSSTQHLLQLMDKATVSYNSNERETFSIDYMRNFLHKMDSSKEDLDKEICTKVEKVIAELPHKLVNGDWNNQKPNFKEIALLKDEIRKKYNFVPKGHYKRVFLPLGFALGLPIGLPIGAVLGNVAIGLPLGIPFGIPIGLAIGAQLDRIAEKEQRAL
jgi:tetrahydromethanopterin S-methyltransferase subunit G